MLLLLVLAFALSGHWLACLWYAIGLSGSCVDGVSQNSSWLNSFSYELRGVRFEFDETCKLLEPPDAGTLVINSVIAGKSHLIRGCCIV